jgi:hypothetical protein
MKRVLSFLIFILSPIVFIGQELTELTILNETLNETSGLVSLNSKLITHNDSGDDPALYEIDIKSGDVARKVLINNAINIDWEDICADNEYIYVGDIGNNSGSRKDLKIYKIRISDYENTTDGAVNAETIFFNYADQLDFTVNENSNNFDAETLISVDNTLYIFTKNRGDNRTNMYAVSKIPGNYSIEKVDSIDAQGLVTGGDYDIVTNTIFLTGYTSTTNFVLEISQFGNEFPQENVKRYLINPQGSRQIEGMSVINQNEFYLSAEKSIFGQATLYKLIRENSLALENFSAKSSRFFPNPASEMVFIECENLVKVELFNFHGTLIKTFYSNRLDVADLPAGVYIALLKKSDGLKTEIRKLIIK